MQVITNAEAEDLDILRGRFTKSKYGHVYEAIRNLPDGHALIVKAEDWGGKTNPQNLLNSAKHGTRHIGFKVSVRRLSDFSGWVIKKR